MYAIVDIAGQQFKVEKDQKLFVHRLEGDEGKKVAFDRVMLLDTGSKVLVGNPVVEGASVSARILAHVKGDKVLVFKKKNRKGYQKLNGHRQYMTQIQIEAISEKSASKPKETAEQKETLSAIEEADAKPATKKQSTSAKKASDQTASSGTGSSAATGSVKAKPASTGSAKAKGAAAKKQEEKD